MNHNEAKKSMAAAAYVLDDLEPSERDAFEEHFFDCTDCTADVLAAEEVADALRTPITNVIPFPHHYSRWAAAAAAAAVAIGLLYTIIPRTTVRPANMPIRSTAVQQRIDLDAPRAAQAPLIIIGSQSVSVGFVIPVIEPRPPYVCELRDDAGAIIGAMTVETKEKASNPVSMVIAAGKFHSGHYTLGIRGDREIPAYDFAVEVH